MKLYKFITILFLVLGTVFTGCSNDPSDDSPKEKRVADKTIIVFMPFTGTGNNSLYSCFIQNICDMEYAIRQRGGLGNNRIIVFISQNAELSHLISLSPKGNSNDRDTLRTFYTPEHLSVEGRARLFNIIRQEAPANVWSMIVSSHGEGWLPPQNAAKRIATRWFGGISGTHKIAVTDLAESVQLTGMKMQYILFDACYMSCVEVAYDLRETTDWLIASTSEVMGYGMPYSNILPILLEPNPDYATLVNTFVSFYNNYSMPYGTIGVTDCRQVEQMADVMRDINATHSLQDTDGIQDLDADHAVKTVYFDFGDYVRHLCADDSPAYEEFDNALSQLVPFKGSTPFIYSYANRKVLKVEHFSGLAVSDPSVNSAVVELKKETAWWKRTHE